MTTPFVRFSFGLLCLLALASPFAGRASVDWPVLGMTPVVTNTFPATTCITHAGDGSQRLFVAQQVGMVSIIQSNTVLTPAFLNITNRVTSAGSEQGLLGVAFPPGFPASGHFYVDYTIATSNSVVISRFQLSATNSSVADPNSEQVLMVIPKPYNNHNGGQLAFGPDGYLYIGVGDGGSEGDPLKLGQSTNSPLAKILRIDVESGASPYAIPPSNPFAAIPGWTHETWAWGLRNPWRFSFDRLTGDLYVGDVGQYRYEEIDFQPAGSPGGQNYGWSIMEGPATYSVPTGFTNFAALTPPIASYSHQSIVQVTDLAGAVTGGYVYRGPTQPRMDGLYFYGDFVGGWIWGLKPDGTNWLNFLLYGPPYPSYLISTFGEDDLGQLYMADYRKGTIYQLYDTQRAWMPLFSNPSGVLNSNTVLVSCVTPNAEIHFTTNNIDPTLSDPVVPAGGVLQVVSGQTNKIRAFRSDLLPSLVTNAVFTLKVGSLAANPPGGAITNRTPVSLTTVTPGAAIYYTTNGTTPTTSSFFYSGPVPLSGSVTLKALGVAPGYANSPVLSVSYSAIPAAQPAFSPPGGVFTNSPLVTISCVTTGAVIRYTLDGTTPSSNSPVYAAPLPLTPPVTLNAIAFRDDLGPSPLQSAFYALLSLDSTVVTTYAGNPTPGYSNAVGALAQFSAPQSVCFGPAGQLYVADLQNYRVRQVLPGGEVQTFAGTGAAASADGPATNAQFIGPYAICCDTAGNVFVSDATCQLWQMRKVDTNSVVSTIAVVPYVCQPTGQMEVDGAGTLYYGYDTGFNAMLPSGQTTLLATLWGAPVGVGIYLQTNLYVVQGGVMLMVLPDGTHTILAGNTTHAGFSDGPPLLALFQGMNDAFVDAPGNVFMTDQSRVRRLNAANTSVFTVAGTGVPGFANGRGSVAQFNGLVGLCGDANGNLYVADSGNNCIRKISPDSAGIGIADDWQLAHFGYIGIDPQADPDHDGLSNYAEFWAGTDPLDPASGLRIDPSSGPVAGHMQVRWQSVAGKSYTVQYSADLRTWVALGSPVQGDGSLLTLADPADTTQVGQRFYRVVLSGF